MSWDYPKPFIQPIAAGSDDIDGLGHVNNATYIRWCESIAWVHSGKLGLTLEDYVAMQRAMAIHRAEYDYQRACFPGDSLQAATWITSSDHRLNMERRFQIVNQDSGQTVFRGCWHLVCVNLKNNRPARMPERFIETYRGAITTAETDR